MILKGNNHFALTTGIWNLVSGIWQPALIHLPTNYLQAGGAQAGLFELGNINTGALKLDVAAA